MADYKCEGCGEVFKEGWSKEEAEAEFKKDFPGLSLTNAGIVCDDCYNSIQKQFND